MRLEWELKFRFASRRQAQCINDDGLYLFACAAEGEVKSVRLYRVSDGVPKVSERTVEH